MGDRGDPGIDLTGIRANVDEVIDESLRRARAELVARAPGAGDVVDEIARLVGAGGKRLRPVLCVLGHLAAGGRVDDAIPAAAGLELFHTFAIVHDDVMDDDDERRGVQATHRRFAGAFPGGDAFGRSVAILVGDLALGLAVDLVLSTPLEPRRVLSAARRLREMVLATAGGQYLDLRGERGASVDELKTAVYTTEVPLAIGAELAGADRPLLDALQVFARPVGVAFQRIDDAADGSIPGIERADAETRRLLDEAEAALGEAPIGADVAAALAAVVAGLRPAA